MDLITGHFAWRELMATDPGAASAFYSALFGWNPTLQSHPETGEYTLFSLGDRPICGLMAAYGDLPPIWFGYASVESVEDATQRAWSAGATILMPSMEIPTIGRFAIIADPEGAHICPFTASPSLSPSMPPPTQTPIAAHGTFGWAELRCGALESAAAFYAKAFRWSFNRHEEPGSTPWLEVQAEPEPVASLGADQVEHAVWHHYVRVASLEKTLERALKLGASVVEPPTAVPGGVTALLADPQGAIFGLWSSNG